MNKKVLIAIPSYNRKDILNKTLLKYKGFDIDVLVFGQSYSEQFVKKHNSNNIIFINYSRPMGIGYIRKNMFEYIFEKLEDEYQYIVTHDDDLSIEKEDVDVMVKALDKRPDLSISTPDIYNLCNKLDYIISDVIFTIGCFRVSKLKSIYRHLESNLNANEDAELVYLMGNKGILINSNKFKTKIDEEFVHSNSVIDSRKNEFEKSSKILKQKYGKQLNISYTETSKNMITKFETFRPTIIFFDGVDKTGKTSLIKEFNKLSNFEFYIADRSPISTIAYSRLFFRNMNEDVLWQFLEMNKLNILFVYTHSSKSKIEKRLKESKHENIDISRNLDVFDDLINELDFRGFNIIKINTNQTSAEYNAKKLLEKIKGGNLND